MADMKYIQEEKWKYSELLKRRCPDHFCPYRPRFAKRPHILALCYDDGIRMPIDYENAFKWFSKAVENGAGACAEHNLARCYRHGKGTPVDKEKAKELEALAVEHGLTKVTKEQ